MKKCKINLNKERFERFKRLSIKELQLKLELYGLYTEIKIILN